MNGYYSKRDLDPIRVKLGVPRTKISHCTINQHIYVYIVHVRHVQDVKILQQLKKCPQQTNKPGIIKNEMKTPAQVKLLDLYL